MFKVSTTRNKSKASAYNKHNLAKHSSLLFRSEQGVEGRGGIGEVKVGLEYRMNQTDKIV